MVRKVRESSERRAPVVAILLTFAMSTMLWAQGGEGTNCELVVSEEDYSCNSGSCEYSIFTAPSSDDDYVLTCRTVTGCHESSHYKVVATLYLASNMTVIASCTNQLEDPPACGGTHDVYNIALEQGVQYRLEVCFTACYDYQCTDCSGCHAVGFVCNP